VYIHTHIDANSKLYILANVLMSITSL